MPEHDKRPPEPRDYAEQIMQAGRESALGILDTHIKRREMELIGLRALRRSLPQEMSREADEALWSILCQYR
jgi:hypothetical protein